LLFNTRSCKPVKRTDREDEESLFLFVERSSVVGRREVSDKLSVSREILYSKVDLLDLCCVGDSDRMLDVTEEVHRK